jgi:hypothetical protein
MVLEVARSRISASELGCVPPKKDPKPKVPSDPRPTHDAERRASTPITPPPDFPLMTALLLTSSNSVALIKASSIIKLPAICAYPIIRVSARGPKSADVRLSGERGTRRLRPCCRAVGSNSGSRMSRLERGDTLLKGLVCVLNCGFEVPTLLVSDNASSSAVEWRSNLFI